MELNQDDIDILDRFYRNELEGDELAELQNRMKDSEFNIAVKSYLESISHINKAGRSELRSLLTSVQVDIEKSDTFEDYKPSKPGKGSGGGGFFTTAFIIIVAGILYLFYTGKLSTEKIQEIIPDADKIDTVYHYNIKRDTVIKYRNDTIKRKTIRSIRRDTIYLRKSVPSNEGDDTVTINKNISLSNSQTQK